MAAAVSLFLELEVEETGEFSLDPGGLDVSTGRDNLVVRAFETLHPADGIAFRLRSEIPLARGLGSSAAAIVAGLYAADHLFELALTREEMLARATAIEGHPDNVAAAIYGGIVICNAAGEGGEPIALSKRPGVAQHAIDAGATSRQRDVLRRDVGRHHADEIAGTDHLVEEGRDRLRRSGRSAEADVPVVHEDHEHARRRVLRRLALLLCRVRVGGRDGVGVGARPTSADQFEALDFLRLVVLEHVEVGSGEIGDGRAVGADVGVETHEIGAAAEPWQLRLLLRRRGLPGGRTLRGRGLRGGLLREGSAM